MPITEDIQTLNFSAQEVGALTGWPDSMIEDYLTIIRNFLLLSTASDGLEAQVDQNTLDITANALQIALNVTAIALNATNIATNTTNISTNATNLTTHEALDSAHGVAGDNVGDEDFCTETVGGVVKLANFVANAGTSSASISSATVAAASATYDQAHIDTIVTLVNDCKSTFNTFVTADHNNVAISKINAIFTTFKTALQMNTS